MKKSLILIISFLLFSIACKKQSEYELVKVILPNGFKVTAEISDTDFKRTLGLMYRENMKENKGMLFIFDEESEKYFWMKNTFISLDIIFISEDKVINHIAHNVQKSSINTPYSSIARVNGYGKYILELSAGVSEKNNLKVGDRLIFDL